MKEIPILMSGPMVQAILAGVKTQTRRIKFRGVPGDTLWVRETWYLDEVDGYYYRADNHEDGNDPSIKWRPSLFMPKEACRIHLRVKAVRRERLWSLENKDAQAEGVKNTQEFVTLWNKLNEKKGYGWYKNPKVYVVSFERI